MEPTAEQLHASLTELTERVNHPLPEMRPFVTELKDPVPSETRPKKVGVLRRAKFDILGDFYNWLMTLPEDAVLNVVCWMQEPGERHDQPAPVKAKKPKKVEGEYGQFWKDMFLEMVIGSADFKMTFPELEEGLDNWSKIVAGHFGLVNESLNTVSPQRLIEFIGRTWANTEKQGIIDRLTKKINEVAGLSNSQFPPSQYFSPAMLGARKIEKKQPEPESDEAFIKEHNMF